MPPPSPGTGLGQPDRAKDDGYAAVEAAWRLDWPKLVAGLTRLVGDIDLAEDLAQDALVAGLQQWPREGVPPRPGAWLMVTARHRALDRLRRDRALAAKYALLNSDLCRESVASVYRFDEDSPIRDDRLRMIFTACHPALSPPAQVALTLRLVGGLTVEEIARAYLVPVSTIAQRIVRAKRTIATQHIPYVVPDGPDLAQRLDSALDVIRLIFTEGMRRAPGTNGCVSTLSRRGCASPGCSPASCPTSLKHTDSSRCWSCKHHASEPGVRRTLHSSCCTIKTGPGGITC